MLKKILHTGLAVSSLEDSIKLYESLGFKVTTRFDKPDLHAKVVMVTKGETTFELFEFENTNNPQIEFIRNHVAIYSDSIEEDVRQLTSKGYKLTIPITEGVIFRYAYVQDKSGANYEIATEKS
jgi:catechol 2,3-dioxygenase-like lactoylglutathione lyase family enzyme